MIGGITDDHWKQIMDLFAKHPNIQEVILYGSRAKGNFREGSDIDLVLKGQQITSVQLTQIGLDYDDLYLPWKLGLTIYDSISNADLKDHIDQVGIKIS